MMLASHQLQESEVFLYLAPQLLEKVASGLPKGWDWNNFSLAVTLGV